MSNLCGVFRLVRIAGSVLLSIVDCVSLIGGIV